ncbi:MAG: glycosyltransferase family 2 protein [Candidatus Omnitrophota bacterium]|jgi:GT2 family glycosyltransferase|nr:MAG: glycosyltransferase family 2 protein [Candidatus Omnitrophota bacterium]
MSILLVSEEHAEKSSPFVSVIILNFNGNKFIQRCLQSVLADSYEPKEIILVDNASRDDSLELARSFADQITIIENPKNYGFPKGCNQGIRQAKGDIIVLLNIDTVVRKDWLNALIEPMMSDAKIGVVGSKLFFLDGKHIQFAGGWMRPNCLTYHEGYGKPDSAKYNVPHEVEYITGASMAIRREVLERTGGLDEGFPLYYDDLDLCYRARKAGFGVYYQPDSVVLHFETFGTKKNSHIYFYKYHRGRIRFLLKNFGIRYFVGTFLPAEIRWYKECNFRQQLIPLASAYLTQFPKAPYYWIRGFVRRRILKRIP